MFFIMLTFFFGYIHFSIFFLATFTFNIIITDYSFSDVLTFSLYFSFNTVLSIKNAQKIPTKKNLGDISTRVWSFPSLICLTISLIYFWNSSFKQQTIINFQKFVKKIFWGFNFFFAIVFSLNYSFYFDPAHFLCFYVVLFVYFIWFVFFSNLFYSILLFLFQTMFLLSLYLVGWFLTFCENYEFKTSFMKDSKLKKETETMSNADYYVATNGSNGNDCTSTASPCFIYYYFILFNNK
jgi:hypothetical protein